MVRKLLTEPALIIGLVESVLALVMAFGLELSAVQTGTIMAVTTALLALVTRALVTPVVSLQDPPTYSPIHRS